jgi:uncharacterized protein (DUF924 family)
VATQTPDDVLRFWFGPEGPEGPIAADVRTRWWRKDPGFDEEIRRRFGELHARACAGELEEWCATPRGCLALVIVLDQFSRNLHRDDPRAWAADEAAQRHCLAAVQSGADAELPREGRAFLYMPLMHAEDRELQALSVRKFGELVGDEPGSEGAVKYAEQHKEIVDRFGRFPHRNAVLGRKSTAEEEAFLREPGSRF